MAKLKQESIIKVLIAKMDSGSDVSRRRLTKAIGVTAMRKLDREWKEEQKARSYRPPEIVSYTSRINKGLLIYTKAEVASFKGSSASSRLYQQSEAILEKAIISLNESLSKKPELCQWLDRPADLSNPDVGLCPVGIPRAVWSSSPYKVKGSHIPPRRIRDLKREALEQALEKSARRCTKSDSLEIPSITRPHRHMLDFSDFKF